MNQEPSNFEQSIEKLRELIRQEEQAAKACVNKISAIDTEINGLRDELYQRIYKRWPILRIIPKPRI